VLPKGFQRIRHYGLLANRHKAERLAKAGGAELPPPEPAVKESVADFARRVLGVDIQHCPVCHEGRMRLVATLPRAGGHRIMFEALTSFRLAAVLAAAGMD